jgi:hypothetical protein
VDLHWHDSEGFTALYLAAGYVHTGVVKDLLEYQKKRITRATPP